MSWGVFPLLFVAHGVSLEGVGLIKAVYPVIWGAGQILTGSLADRIGRKPLIVWGMVVQAVGHAVIGLGLAAPMFAGLVGSSRKRRRGSPPRLFSTASRPRGRTSSRTPLPSRSEGCF